MMYAIFTPNAQLFLSKRGFDYDQIGIILGVFQVVGIIGPLIIGRLADRNHRYKYWLLFCLLIVPVIFSLLFFTTSFFLTIVIMSVMGIFMRTTVSLSDTLVSNSLERPEEQYGKIRPAGSLGFMAMGLLLDFTGFLKENMTLKFPLIFAGSLIFSAFILIFLPRATHFDKKQSEAREAAAPKQFSPFFFLVLIALLFGWISQAGYMSFYSLYLKELTPIKNINMQWALGALVEIPVMFLSGWFIKKVGMKPLFLFALLVISFRLFLYSLIPSPVILTASQALHAVTFGLFHAVGIGFINRNTPLKHKGLGMALYSSFLRGTSAFIGSALGGILAKAYGIDRMFFFFSLIPLPGFILLLFWKERRIHPPGKKPREELVEIL